MRWVVAAGLAWVGCSFEAPKGAGVPDGGGGGDDAAGCVATGHDEDRDGVADVCDACPQIANAAPGDRDGDGIPDACDPHFDTAGDVLVQFEAFATDGPVPEAWQARGGGSQNDWQVSGDVLHVTSMSPNTHILIFDSGARHHTIDVGFDITAVFNNGFQFVTVIGDSPSDVTHFMGCGIRVDNDPPAPDREIIQLDMGNFSQHGVDPVDPPAPAGAYRIVFTIDQDNEICSIPGDKAHTLPAMESTRDNRFVGLRLDNATIAFRYAAIYRAP